MSVARARCPRRSGDSLDKARKSGHASSVGQHQAEEQAFVAAALAPAAEGKAA